MKTVIFQNENSVFEFLQKEIKEHLLNEHSQYDPDEAAQLTELISTRTGEIILNSYNHHYFGFVILDLISEGMGTASCKICRKTYDAPQLKGIDTGHGKSPLKINHKPKGGFSTFRKKKNPSMFGGRGFKCPEGHTVISMETWKI